MTAFATSRHGKLLRSLGHVRRPSLGFLGESHGQRVAGCVSYALQKIYHADVFMDPRDYASGGQMFAVGGTTTAHLIGTQIPQFVARPADIAFIANGYNDLSSGTISLATTEANILSATNSCLAAGALAVVLVGQTPLAGAAANAMQLNNYLRNLAANSPQIFFLDVTSILADPAASSPAFNYRGPSSGAFASLTTDGTHWSGTAKRLIAPQIATILQLFAPERRPRVNMNAGTYDPAGAPYCNMLGDGGNMMGTNGVWNSAGNTGIPGIGSDRWISGTTGLSGATVTPSIVTDANDGHRMQRFTFSGTLGSGAYGGVSMQFFPPSSTPNNGDSTRRMTVECEIRLNAVTGFVEPVLVPLNNNAYATISLAEATYDQSAGYANTTTETLFLYTTFPIPVPSAWPSPGFALNLNFRDSCTLAGTIDIGRFLATLSA